MIKLSCSVITVVACTGLALSWYALESETSAQVTASGRQDLEARINGTVREAGTLESAETLAFHSLIPGETTIVSLVPDGSRVSKGDVLVELDGSLIEEQLQKQQIVTIHADADVERAKSLVEQTNLETEIALEENRATSMLATKFVEQSSPETAKIEMDIRTREKKINTLEKKIEDVNTLRSLVKGMHRETIEYRLMLRDLEIELATTKEELVHLNDFVLPIQKFRETIQASVAEKQLNLQKLKSAANRGQAEAEMTAAISAYRAESQRLEALQQQLNHCRIVAPRDGIVVYANQSSRRAEPVAIQEGATVRERQILLSMPDLEHLQMNVHVHESKIARVKKGQSATIMFDAFPARKFRGTVTSISDTALPGVWPNTDVKEFEVIVSLEKPDPQFKLGLTGLVEIDVTK